eukprot:GFYU01001184.1.p1 GENE.GFYU01001184.1~~GFYU01001184.1.p1  ORF type:complete len:258 (+),score=34.64 GFYU01001184.1:149-922(+)
MASNSTATNRSGAAYRRTHIEDEEGMQSRRAGWDRWVLESETLLKSDDRKKKTDDVQEDSDGSTEFEMVPTQECTVMITHFPRPGKMEALKKWIRDVTAMNRTFTLDTSTTVLESQDAEGGRVISILKFNSLEEAHAVASSPVRAEFLERYKEEDLARKPSDAVVLEEMSPSFVPVPIASETIGGNAIPTWKMVIMLWLCVYVNVYSMSQLLPAVIPGFKDIPMVFAMGFSTFCVVLLNTYFSVPLMLRIGKLVRFI